MPFRPFPENFTLRSQELTGGYIGHAPEGYLIASIDGSARGNPGPAGYGVILEDEIGRRVAEFSEFLGRQTSTYAWYAALLGALNYTFRHGFKAMKVVSNNERLVKQVKGEAKVSTPTVQDLHERVARMLDQFHYFEIKYVPVEKNSDASHLASVAIDRGIENKAPAVEATEVGGVPSVIPEMNGVVRNGVVYLLRVSLPDGMHVKVRPSANSSKP